MTKKNDDDARKALIGIYDYLKLPRLRTTDANTIARRIRKAIDDLKDASPDTPAPGALGTEPMNTFDDLVEQEIERFGDEAVRPAGGALANRAPGLNPYQSNVISQIWRELGIPGDTMSEDEILAAVRNLKNAGGDVEAEATPGTASGHSLVEAMAHGRQLEHGLREELTRARSIIGRVAGALQVSQWDADGTEIVERAQRVEKAKHELRRVISVLRASSQFDQQPQIVDMVSSVLATLTSTAAVMKFLENKPAAVRAMETAPTPDLGRFRALATDDVLKIGSIGHEPDLQDVLLALRSGPAGVLADFVTFMNLVIIPRLAILGMPATRGSAD